VPLPDRRRDDAVLTASFDGKVALVTGAAGGMGRAIALSFGAAGASVVAADIAAEGGAETVELIRQAGGQADFVVTDVAEAASVEQLVAQTVGGFGGLDCAVNAAAIELETVRLADVEDEVFDRLVAVNLRSIFLCMKHELRAMLAQGRGGAIVNIASTNSFRPQPHQSAYTATKHGVLGITRNAAIDYAGDGIRINAICPGAIDTPMLRAAIERRERDPDDVAARLSLLGRFGETSEIANAALWLCSDESSFTVGHALAVDGGYLAR
jgi:NAD(P)-dependent dehydrogenase (short-subunit alcohol dehydrogenase family)